MERTSNTMQFRRHRRPRRPSVPHRFSQYFLSLFKLSICTLFFIGISSAETEDASITYAEDNATYTSAHYNIEITIQEPELLPMQLQNLRPCITYLAREQADEFLSSYFNRRYVDLTSITVKPKKATSANPKKTVKGVKKSQKLTFSPEELAILKKLGLC